VDFDTLKDRGSVTLREWDSMIQVRGLEDEVVMAIRGLVEGAETWERVMGRTEGFGGREEGDYYWREFGRKSTNR
jgi:glycyl-tRNA synthetase